MREWLAWLGRAGGVAHWAVAVTRKAGGAGDSVGLLG